MYDQGIINSFGLKTSLSTFLEEEDIMAQCLRSMSNHAHLFFFFPKGESPNLYSRFHCLRPHPLARSSLIMNIAVAIDISGLM